MSDFTDEEVAHMRELAQQLQIKGRSRRDPEGLADALREHFAQQNREALEARRTDRKLSAQAARAQGRHIPLLPEES